MQRSNRHELTEQFGCTDTARTEPGPTEGCLTTAVITARERAIRQAAPVAARAVGDGVVVAVGGGVDGDDVGAVGEVIAAENGESPGVLGEHGDGPAFGGDVEPLLGLVEREDVGTIADRQWVPGLVGVQVEGVQGGVAVAGDEPDPVFGVKGHAVLVLAAGDVDPLGDGEGCRNSPLRRRARAHPDVRVVRATISPDNNSSRALVEGYGFELRRRTMGQRGRPGDHFRGAGRYMDPIGSHAQCGESFAFGL